MKHKWKRLLAAMLVFCMCGNLTGCYDNSEVNEQVFPFFLGLDEGQNNNLLITVKFPTYAQGGSSGGGGGGSSGSSSGESQSLTEKMNQGNSNVYTIEAPTILEGIELLSTTLPRSIVLTHVEFLCISQDLARKGISTAILPLVRDSNSSMNMKVLVIQGSASDFILNHKAPMSGSYAREATIAYENPTISSDLSRVQFGEFYAELYSPYQDAVALAGGLHSNEENRSTATQPDGLINDNGTGFTVEDSPITGPQPAQISGFAVFRGDRLAGILDTYESDLYLLMRGMFLNDMTFKEPADNTKFLALKLVSGQAPKLEGWEENGVRHVRLTLNLEGTLNSVQSGMDYENEQHLEAFNKYVSSTLQLDMQTLLTKLQKEYNADIFGFGRAFLPKSSTISDWDAIDWFHAYPKCQLEVKVNYITRRAGILYQVDDQTNLYNFPKFKSREG